MKAVGAKLPRYDGIAHVTGRTVYVDDVAAPGMLAGARPALAPPPRRDHAAWTPAGPRSCRVSARSSPTQTCRTNVYGHLEALGVPADEPLLAEDVVR